MFRKFGVFKILILFLLFSFCFQDKNNRGCSGCGCYKVVEEESEVRKIDDLKVKITAQKVKDTKLVNTRGGRLNFELGTRSSFFVRFKLEVSGCKPIYNLCEHYALERDDLNKSLKIFDIVLKEKHLAVGLKDNPRSFHHQITNKLYFSSGYYYFDNTNIEVRDLTFDKIDWSIFPDPDSLFQVMLLDGEKSNYGADDGELIDVLKEMPAGNKHELFLINNWYNSVARSHFTKRRVQKIVKKSPQWKSVAIKKAFIEISNPDKYNTGFYPSIMLINAIKDKEALLKLDKYLLFEMNDSRDNMDDYFWERYNNKEIPLSKESRLKLQELSEEILYAYPDDKEMFDVEFAIGFLIKEKQLKEIEGFLDKIISNEGLTEFMSKSIQLTIGKYHKYPDELKPKIVEKYTKVMQGPSPEISSFDMAKIFRFLKDKISCQQLKPIYNNNKDRLSRVKLPKKCKD